VLSFPAVDGRLPILLPKLITALGLICLAVSLSLLFVDDTLPFGVPYIVGIVLSFGGTIAWARAFEVRAKCRLAGYISLLGLIVFFFVPNNVHGDGMLVGFIVLCGWLLSVILLTMAAVTAHDARRHGI